MKVYDIWAEGYAATGESGGAVFLGQAYAEFFKEACDKHAASDEGFKKFYNPDRLTYWSCKLFDNRHDAQRNFG